VAPFVQQRRLPLVHLRQRHPERRRDRPPHHAGTAEREDVGFSLVTSGNRQAEMGVAVAGVKLCEVETVVFERAARWSHQE
jgi:hypothetical protein